jgi:hypothetical protein
MNSAQVVPLEDRGVAAAGTAELAPPPKVTADFVEVADDTPEFRALFEEGKDTYLLANIKTKFRPFDIILFGTYSHSNAKCCIFS